MARVRSSMRDSMWLTSACHDASGCGPQGSIRGRARPRGRQGRGRLARQSHQEVVELAGGAVRLGQRLVEGEAGAGEKDVVAWGESERRWSGVRAMGRGRGPACCADGPGLRRAEIARSSAPEQPLAITTSWERGGWREVECGGASGGPRTCSVTAPRSVLLAAAMALRASTVPAEWTYPLQAWSLQRGGEGGGASASGVPQRSGRGGQGRT